MEKQWQMELKQQKSPQVQEHFLTTQQRLQEMVPCDLKWKEPSEQSMQPSQMGQMKLHHHGVITEGWSSTMDSCFQDSRMVPQLHMEHNLEALQCTYTGKPLQVQDHWWTHTRKPQDQT